MFLFKGVFGDDESEEEERPGFGRKGNSAFSSQINFISGGIRTVGEKPEKKESDDEDVSLILFPIYFKVTLLNFYP